MVVVLPEPAHASTIKLSFEWSKVSIATCCSRDGGKSVRDLSILVDKASGRSGTGTATGAVAAAIMCARRLDPPGLNKRELVHGSRRGILTLAHGVRNDSSRNLRGILSSPVRDVLVARQHASIDSADMTAVAQEVQLKIKPKVMLARGDMLIKSFFSRTPKTS